MLHPLDPRAESRTWAACLRDRSLSSAHHWQILDEIVRVVAQERRREGPPSLPRAEGVSLEGGTCRMEDGAQGEEAEALALLAQHVLALLERDDMGAVARTAGERDLERLSHDVLSPTPDVANLEEFRGRYLRARARCHEHGKMALRQIEPLRRKLRARTLGLTALLTLSWIAAAIVVYLEQASRERIEFCLRVTEEASNEFLWVAQTLGAATVSGSGFDEAELALDESAKGFLDRRGWLPTTWMTDTHRTLHASIADARHLANVRRTGETRHLELREQLLELALPSDVTAEERATAHADFFRSIGVTPGERGIDETLGTLRSEGDLTAHLAMALDRWALLLRPKEPPHARNAPYLLHLADQLDPHPLRSELRLHASSASEPPALRALKWRLLTSRSSTATLSFLATWLAAEGEREPALGWARIATHHHPEDPFAWALRVRLADDPTERTLGSLALRGLRSTPAPDLESLGTIDLRLPRWRLW